MGGQDPLRQVVEQGHTEDPSERLGEQEAPPVEAEQISAGRLYPES